MGDYVSMSRLAMEFKKESDRTSAEIRGAVSYLLSRHQTYRRLSFSSLCAWVDPAIDLGQIRVFYDQHGRRPVGYVTWAFLTSEVEMQWQSDPTFILHQSEWNEGDRLWFVDLVAQPSYCLDICRLIMLEMFPGQTVAYSLRRGSNGRMTRVRTWQRDHALTEILR